MCGICGEIRQDERPVNLKIIQAMNRALEPRGPDTGGVYAQGNRAFGHRRLKIIDLTERAQQPMIDNDLGIGIVFNGMIYNYREIRSQLQSMGYHFFSTGDTEVLLKAYHAWGESFVDKLIGMFAFAIWERDSDKVLLCRDRLGIKPLYTAEQNGCFRFASTLPALLAAGGVDSEIDPVALHYYMSFHSVVPAPHTILKGIKKLPPAAIQWVIEGHPQPFKHYWSLRYGLRPGEKKRSFEEWSHKLETELRQAVKRRMLADVPVGVLLSGGVDSSLIVGLLAEEGQQHLNTFSVGFESIKGEEGDEFQYSDLIAQHYDTRHHKIKVPADTVLSNLSDCIAAMSEPMVSHDVIGFYLLSREVSKHIKVVQSGQGADEIFGGYHWYPPMINSRAPQETYRKVFFDRSHEEFLNAVHPRFHGDNYSLRFVNRYFSSCAAVDPVDKALHIDTNIMLVEDPVKRVDNMTMAWGIEARVPFLDHELVEFVARIPSFMKVSNGGKHILKDMARRIIPNKVIDRPKGYFPVPVLKYLRGAYLDQVRNILNSQKARQRDLFQKDYVDMLFENPEEHITPLRGSKLWQISLLEWWLQIHNI